MIGEVPKQVLVSDETFSPSSNFLIFDKATSKKCGEINQIKKKLAVWFCYFLTFATSVTNFVIPVPPPPQGAGH